MGRRPCCEKVGLHRGGWSALEDQILSDYIKANGEGDWRELPKKAGLKRCGKSCRLRWLNYLNPKIIRGNITQKEDELIISLHRRHGNRWSLIAGQLPGRTDNEIKNYWNTILGKKVHGVHVVPKRKSRKQTDEKKLNSNLVPRRRSRTTILPTLTPNSGSASDQLTSESTGPVVTPQDSSARLIRNNALPQVASSQVIANSAECYNQGQLLPSQGKITEFRRETMQIIGHTDEKCSAPQQSGSCEENNKRFMGEIMQDIGNCESPQHQVYGKWYRDLISDIALADMEEYSMFTGEIIFSELSFTSDECMFEHWVANSYTEHCKTFDLGSLATPSF